MNGDTWHPGDSRQDAQSIPHDGELSAPAATQLITPTNATPAPAAAPAPVVPAPVTAAPVASMPAAVDPVDDTLYAPDEAPIVDDRSQGGFFRDQAPDMPLDPRQPHRFRPSETDAPIEWTAGASGEVKRKTASWYAMLLGIGVVIAALVFLITRDKFSTVVVVIAVPLFGLMSVHRPHPVSYSISNRGITIGRKAYAYEQFRSFSVIEDSFGQGVLLSPLQRFMPFVNIRFDDNFAEQVVNALSQHLPMEEHKADAMDRIGRSLRF